MSAKMQAMASIPWLSPHIMHGAGYDIMKREILSTALEPVQTTTIHAGRKVNMMSTVISTQSDLDRAIKDSVTASAPIEGIKIEVSSSYLNKIKTSKTEMTTLIECVIEDAPHQVQKPELTGKAKALLDKDPQKFIERHGQYFVVGSQNRARLVALCHHKANSEEALNEFKASISAEAPEVGGIHHKLEFTNETNKYRVSTTVSVFVDGYGKSATETVMLNTTEVDSTFKEFQHNTQPVPFVALLQHYNTLDERVPTPGEHFDRTSAKLSEAYQRIFFLQSRVISCPLVGSEGLAQEVADHFDDLRKNIHPDEKDWLERLDVWSKKANELTQGFQQWQLRERLLKDSEKLSLPLWPTPNVNTDDGWIPAGIRQFWAKGVIIDDGHPLYGEISSEIEHSNAQENNWQVVWKAWPNHIQRHRMRLGKQGRKIVGIKINSHWNDGTNGYWRLLEGKVGDDEIEIQFCTAGHKGGHWSAEIWSVDKHLYSYA